MNTPKVKGSDLFMSQREQKTHPATTRIMDFLFEKQKYSDCGKTDCTCPEGIKARKEIKTERT